MKLRSLDTVRASELCFAAALIGLGVLGIIYRDFALVWQPVPKWVPGREALAYVCAAIMLGGGLGLPWKRTRRAAAGTLFVYLVLWLLLLRVPALFSAPLSEVSWSGCGETALTVAGGWVLFASLAPPPNVSGPLRWVTGASGVYAARILLGLALIPCGLAHFAYVSATAELVPQWLPGHVLWAYTTGAGFIAASIAVLSGILARLAAGFVAAMMGAFTLLVWLPKVIHAPTGRFEWTALLISSALSTSAWVVAATYRR